ncbi:aldose epimerase family protein [Limosilactobacillus sp.]|uniref:aldose epimerase family protein n=1 Tax=Limosilactobacillus sp. TaxID=2773925 RepID=UPI00345E8BF2
MKITHDNFGEMNSHPVTRYTVTNDHHVRMSVLNYGGIWQEFSVLTPQGRLNLLLSADSVENYQKSGYCVCQLIGPVANRIGHAQFQIDGHNYQLQANEGNNTNHSGDRGWQNHFWHVDTQINENSGQIILSNHYRPKDDGMPGVTNVQVVYTLDNQNQVTIDFYGHTDAATLFNPTNHSYWNLADRDARTVEAQELMINSEQHLAVDDGKIPTGQLVNNQDSAYDFKHGRLLGDALHEMLKTREKGFDDFFVVEPSTSMDHQPIAVLRDPESGREMKMFSDRNALVVYTANGMPDSVQLNRPGRSWVAIALEAQTLPDSVHHPEFGDIILRSLEPVHHQIRYEITY